MFYDVQVVFKLLSGIGIGPGDANQIRTCRDNAPVISFKTRNYGFKVVQNWLNWSTERIRHFIDSEGVCAHLSMPSLK